ncbi:hypothetical protein SAMN02746089_02707 [Caldanaerobius fijiensis DSM 17918]|uniref:Holliday junction resolvase RusA (Prophage-encoded endonuclease) n=1 Tax=Caldanaerobius fijiensis DSM 17918 TaxID=1121256 RepID=A0A1M5FA17_9THEO|nr:hypothetical protein [Caldanaerobius fijiensis]SHF87911.1 hypothetical protein SAMN02746089_02707 [Caldanaerobius fijiensis DSM 17918]
MDEHVMNAYEAIEKARKELYWAFNESIRRGEPPAGVLPSDDVKVSLDDGVISIHIPDYPPRTAKAKQYAKDRWLNNVLFAIQSLDKCPRFDKAFIWIKFFLPARDWDVDNRDISPIINGVRYAGIIKDDTFKHVSYGCEGFQSDNPHTEIYIVERNCTDKILDVINKNG